MKDVPTAKRLAEMGREYAIPTQWRKGRLKNDKPEPTAFLITAAGHKLLGDIMRENAQERLGAGEGVWFQPPSRGPIGKPLEN